jgi:hypothetical protein
MPVSVAVIVAEPCPTPVASPRLLIVATDGALEDQLTWLVRSCVLLSEKVPVALNCCADPTVIDAFAGLTPTDTNEGDDVMLVTV